MIGDETLRGKRTVSELEATDPDLINPIDDAHIWRPSAPAWELVKPGVNTDPNGNGTTFW